MTSSAASGAGHSPNAAFTALLSQHRMLLGVPFALHTEPHAKRSEIKSHKVQIQNQLHNATFRQKGNLRSETGVSWPLHRPMCALRNQGDALGG